MKKNKLNDRKRTFLLITIPIVALFFCFNTLPLIKGVIYSFTNFKGYGSYDWVGLRNYKDLFTDSRVGGSYIFTFKLAIAFGKMIGSETFSSSMLSNTKLAWIAIVIVCAWQSIAMNTIIYISGLQTVPEDVYEAGAIDGATGWKKFKNLTFPLIIPFFSINMVLSVKNFLMVFDQIMALTKGGPAQSTESISYLIYNNGMSGGQFGFQSANAVIFFIVIVVISVAQMTITGKKEEQL